MGSVAWILDLWGFLQVPFDAIIHLPLGLPLGLIPGTLMSTIALTSLFSSTLCICPCLYWNNENCLHFPRNTCHCHQQRMMKTQQIWTGTNQNYSSHTSSVLCSHSTRWRVGVPRFSQTTHMQTDWKISDWGIFNCQLSGNLWAILFFSPPLTETVIGAWCWTVCATASQVCLLVDTGLVVLAGCSTLHEVYRSTSSSWRCPCRARQGLI